MYTRPMVSNHSRNFNVSFFFNHSAAAWSSFLISSNVTLSVDLEFLITGVSSSSSLIVIVAAMTAMRRGMN